MKIINAQVKDAREISRLKKETIKNINQEYNDKQIKTFTKLFSLKNTRRHINERKMFCLVDKGNIIGTVDLKEDRIGGLFVKFNLVGKGYGKKLMSYIEKFAKKKKLKKVWLYSTPYAEKFYKKLGYKVVERGTWVCDNVRFSEIKMEKRL
ncbi:GNAT family N-acetyltransferase [Candidatus Pacearchaeota archaeon]|nr:GNAT family N-acetyltransferase [Candidatus Pacearchaeota archaeon]